MFFFSCVYFAISDLRTQNKRYEKESYDERLKKQTGFSLE